MIDITIQGRIKNKSLVRFYIESLIHELGMGKMRKPEILVKFRTNAGGAFGLCDGAKGEYAVIHIARTCPVTQRKLGFLEMMQTLAHEMVHARQFIRGELKNECGWAWKGRKADGYNYDNQPWEKEAFRLEKKLFMKCFPHFADFTN